MEGCTENGFPIVEHTRPRAPSSLKTDVINVCNLHGERVEVYNTGNLDVDQDTVKVDNANRKTAVTAAVASAYKADGSEQYVTTRYKLPLHPVSLFQLYGMTTNWQGKTWQSQACQGDEQLVIHGQDEWSKFPCKMPTKDGRPSKVHTMSRFYKGFEFNVKTIQPEQFRDTFHTPIQDAPDSFADDFDRDMSSGI